MRLIDADALSKELDNLDKKFGIGSCGDGITICMEAVGKAPTIIDCGEMDHEILGKIPYMDLRPRMTKEKLNEITSKVADIFTSYGFGNCIVCKNPDCDECNEKYTIYDALDVLASVHNELYREVNGEYYDYMFHWANHGYGGSPNDSMFKDQKEGETNEAD